ncbi:MAG: hypothetical protein Q7K44_01880 [Candidatus Liptonbacteria bacterium]|nr:hypothetical protein [Candidatus Liptonbacteria bacterium]
MIKAKLLGLALAVSLVSLLGGCATVGHVSHDAAVGVHSAVAGEAKLVGGLVQETLTKPSHATLWHWLVSPVDAAKVLVDSAHKMMHDMGHHLHGR